MSKSKIVKAAIVIIILGAAVYFGFTQHEGRPISVGDSAPDFSVPALSAGSIDLKSYQGHVVVLNFWATWCPPCVEETPSLVQFADKTKAQGVVVLGISVDDNEGALESFVRENHLDYPIGRDPNRALASRYGTYQFPETYILDRRGKLADKVIGGTDWSDQRMEKFVLTLAGATGE